MHCADSILDSNASVLDNTPMSTRSLPARLNRITREMRWTRAQMAKAIGADPSTVSKWINDGHKRIDPAYAFRLQDITGFCARWILLGEGPAHVSEPDLSGLLPELREELSRHTRTIAQLCAVAKQA